MSCLTAFIIGVSQTFKMTKKARKWDKHGHNFIIFSQASGQTWYHTSAYHLSALITERNDDDISGFHKALFASNWFATWADVFIHILTERSDDDISCFHKALFASNWFPDV